MLFFSLFIINVIAFGYSKKVHPYHQSFLVSKTSKICDFVKVELNVFFFFTYKENIRTLFYFVYLLVRNFRSGILN